MKPECMTSPRASCATVGVPSMVGSDTRDENGEVNGADQKATSYTMLWSLNSHVYSKITF